MERPRKSFRPSIQNHFYKQMKKCPCMQMTPVMYDHSDDECGRGMKSYEWLLGQIAPQMLKGRGPENSRSTNAGWNLEVARAAMEARARSP
eukprot:9485026-Pyramimonas_sp.AAC.1